MSISKRGGSNFYLKHIESLMANGQAGAIFSEDRRHRFLLWRGWSEAAPRMLFIGLNPSVADECSDDPTIRRCIGFAKKQRMGGILVGNLFSYCATKPRDMMRAVEPVAEPNDEWLAVASKLCKKSVACWGVHGAYLNRSVHVSGIIKKMYCFGLNKDGEPKHPLYLNSDTSIRIYKRSANLNGCLLSPKL